MATHIEITRAGAISSAGFASVETTLVASQTITPSASNQITTFTNLPTADGLFVSVTADENVFISIGVAPNALTDPAKRAMAAGATRSFTIGSNQQVAVVTR